MQRNAVQATTTLLFTSTKNREIFHYQQGQNKQQHAPDIHQNITQLKRLATKAILIHFKTLFTQSLKSWKQKVLYLSTKNKIT